MWNPLKHARLEVIPPILQPPESLLVLCVSRDELARKTPTQAVLLEDTTEQRALSAY